MTGLYEWTPLPHLIDIKCPVCGACAVFEFAKVARIHRRDDIPFFQSSDQFEYRRFQDSSGNLWHGAIFYQGLHGEDLCSISELPAGYQPSDWEHSRYWSRDRNLGSVNCEFCHLRAKHVLKWPVEAYYCLSYKGEVLWAFNQESAEALLDYIGGKKRDLSNCRWRYFLLHVPSVFKGHKARYSVCKQLRRLLEAAKR